MRPGSWLKHYVFTEASWQRRPIYFLYIEFSEVTQTHHLRTENRKEIYVGDLFLSWLEPIDETDKPKMREPIYVKPKFSPPLNKKGGGTTVEKAVGATAAAASIPKSKEGIFKIFKREHPKK